MSKRGRKHDDFVFPDHVPAKKQKKRDTMDLSCPGEVDRHFNGWRQACAAPQQGQFPWPGQVSLALSFCWTFELEVQATPGQVSLAVSLRWTLCFRC
jgi:hypothetical protein